MPWHLSADLKYFKRITLGAPVLMGRITFEAIGRPLPGRTNLIISSNPAFQAPGCLGFTSVEAAIEHSRQYPELFVIGGASLYKALLPQADFLYLTEIHRDFAGDTCFPEFDRTQWREVDRLDVLDDRSVDFAYSFIKLERW